jgi:hypothetical protein
MKTCSKCKLEKLLSDFPHRKGKASSWCKLCYSNYRKEKGYDSYLKRSKYFVCYQRNLRKSSEHKKRDNSYRKAYASTFSGTVTNLLCGAKDRAKIRKLQINLDRKWVEERLAPLKCEVTGIDLVLTRQSGYSHSPFRPSIDRIDNTKGYTKDNCRIVCVIYNKAKSDYNDEDVIKMAKGLLSQ